MFSAIFGGCCSPRPQQTGFQNSSLQQRQNNKRQKNIMSSQPSNTNQLGYSNNDQRYQEEQYFIVENLSKMNLDDNSFKKHNVLFITQDDTNILNKYRLNYACLCQNYSQIKAKNDLLDLSKKFYKQDSNNIKNFENSYKLGLSLNQSNQQIIQWAYKKSFLWDIIQRLPKSTTDPKKLAYLRLPFKDLHRAIKSQYKKISKKPNILYIVANLTKAQQKKFKQNIDNFVFFSTFVKGFTNQKQAKKTLKERQGSVILEIRLQSKKDKDEKLDFGFVINSNPDFQGQNVIFNINNFYQIKEVQLNAKTIQLTYGGLAQASFIRSDPKKRFSATPYQYDLLRNHDYTQDILRKANSQAAILQMSGYFKQSMQVFENKSNLLRKSNANQDVMDKCYLQVGDAYKLCDDIKKSHQSYNKVSNQKMKIIAKIHKAQLYYQNKEFKKFNELIKEVQPKINEVLTYDPPQAFKAMNYVGIAMMENGDLKGANKKFRQILPILTKHYDYKFEGIPLVHDIMRNIGACQSKLENYPQALNLLKSAKGWQKACQGNSPNYALTETMIQQVHLSKGDQSKVKQSQAEITDIKKSYPVEEQKYLKMSKVIVNVNQSAVNIQL